MSAPHSVDFGDGGGPMTTKTATLLDVTNQAFIARWAGTKDEDRARALLDDLVRTCGGGVVGDAQGVVDTYQAEMSRRGYKGGTWNRRCSMLSVVFRYAASRGLIVKAPEIRKRREGPGRSTVLSVLDEHRLMSHIGDRCAYGADARHFTAFLLNTGLRLSEALALTYADVIAGLTGPKAVVVRDSKSGRSRTVPLNARAAVAVSQNSGKTASPWSSLSARTFQRVVRDAARSAGLTDVCVHTFRHTFATRLIAGGVSIVAAQRLLGHSSVAVTMRYAHASQGDLESAVEMLR